MVKAQEASNVTMALALAAVLDEFRGRAPDIAANTMVVFFHVAAQPGIRMKELERLTSLSSSAVARNVSFLSDQDWRRDSVGKRLPGLDLVVAVTDPFDGRSKVVTLTPRGRKMFDKVAALASTGRR